MILDGNQYKMIVESSPNLLWRSGTDGLCNYFNSTWLAFTGKTMEQEIGNGWAEGVHPDDLELCLKIYSEAFDKRQPFEMIYRLKRFDEEWRWINDRGVPYYNESGQFEGYIGSCLDINEQVNGELWKKMAQKDGLTGINNRQHFEQLARVEFDKTQRFNKELCIIMVDIDNFKFINDHFGHQTGDKVIRAFAKLFEDNIREFDILGRYGGDEFIIMLPDTNYNEAAKLINRLNDITIRPLYFDNLGEFNISFSYGIAKIASKDTFDSLVSKADKQMYKCKSDKKGPIVS